MTFGRWIEIFFGVVLPGIFVIPSLVFLMAVPLLVVFRERMEVWVTLLTILYSTGWMFISGAIGIGAIISLGLLILFGPTQISQRFLLRRFVIAMAFLGLALGLVVFIVSLFEQGGGIVHFYDRYEFFLGLIGPIVVGSLYLWKLLRGVA